MSHEPDLSRLEDFFGNPTYERRVVIFYDVLGWRSHIERAGQDAVQIGNLRRLILLHVRTMQLRKHWNISVSTFSDNVVITQPLGKMTDRLITHLAISQITSGLAGFLLRGGVTIGDVVHDGESVFGPGLNRAYELESKVARFPRFVLDPKFKRELSFGALPVEEEGVTFLDPFRTAFVDHLRSATQAAETRAILEAGVPAEDSDIFESTPTGDVLKVILDQLKLQIRSPLRDQDWEKVAWVYDRIAREIGVPPASSYPRVRPGDVVGPHWRS